MHTTTQRPPLVHVEPDSFAQRRRAFHKQLMGTLERISEEQADDVRMARYWGTPDEEEAEADEYYERTGEDQSWRP